MEEEAASKKPESPLLAKVEDTARAVFRFLRQFLVTLLHAGFSPARFAGRLRDETGRATFVGPYTFITFSGFAVVKLLRWMIIVGLILFSSIFRGCSMDTPQKIVEPTPASLLVLPSIDEMLFIGIPLIAGILALTWLLRTALTKTGAALQPAFVEATCYAVGFQYLLCLPALAVGFWITFGNGMRTAPDALRLSILWLVAIVLVAWPAYCFHRLIDSREIAESPRFGARALHKAMLWLGSLVLCASTLALALGLAWPLATAEYNAKYDPKPILQVTRIDAGGDAEVRPSMRIPLSVSNASDESLQFTLDKAEVIDTNGTSFDARITAGKSLPGYVFSLAPRERAWIVLTVGEPNRNSHISSSEHIAIILRSIGRDGGREPIEATVR